MIWPARRLALAEALRRRGHDAIQVREVIVIDRDSKRPELYRLAGSQFVLVQRDSQGWLASEKMSVRFNSRDEQPRRLIVEDLFDNEQRQEI